MKLDKVSIKWKLFVYLSSFAAIMIILLWLFQIVFLDSFYKSIKTQNIKSSAESIAKHIDKEDIESIIENISEENGICVKIVDKNGSEVYSAHIIPECIIDKMPPSEISRYYVEAENNGGTTFELFSLDNFKNKPFDDRIFMGKNPPPDRGMIQSMIYGRLVGKQDGTEYMILLNSTITPVNTTVETLRVQLLYITVILLILSIVLALFMSRRISKPIIKINNSAKDLASGNYDTTFNGRGYLEIAELNDTLNYAAKELSKVEELRRELIANISHDLRTPLTMITGYGEVMRDIPGENTPENVQIIIDEAKRLTTLVNDILNVSKLQSGTQELDITSFNITNNIRDILKRYTKLTQQDGYNIEFVSQGDVYVKADEVKISQVIYNLINNAITYTGLDKKVTISQSCEEGLVKIQIIDTGEGIAEEKLPYIWDRYYKGGKAHKRAAIGTGLGLSIVKTILDMHGAQYGVISSEGNGAIFWFQFKIENIF